MAEDAHDPPAAEGPDGGVVDNPWASLRAYTDARIGLGRAGISLPTAPLLAFQLAHAQAKDAVHTALDTEALTRQLAGLAHPLAQTAPLLLATQAGDRATYLQRPDLGRRLDEPSRERLAEAHGAGPADLALVLADGLSARAVAAWAVPVIDALCTALAAAGPDWRLAPVCLVRQGRVAIGDEVGERLQARAVVVFIGERPGLSSPDSLGLYLTWAPRPGVTDAERNCISNVRRGGLAPVAA
ncbi:MAG TPA: ethanolamine ammonia-lyase subunit EutC, partial [Gammaproteobacteria bacterium]|nr:ethanolamine ammonia-lyase subunit EutC [Gammaproteobacteria bacterium]